MGVWEKMGVCDKWENTWACDKWNKWACDK